MSSLSVCTPWRHTSGETLSRTIDSSLSLCLHVGIKSFVGLFSVVYTCKYATGCLEGVHTILIMDKIQTGPDQRLACLSLEQMLAVYEAVSALLGDWLRPEYIEKRFSFFFHHSILMSNQRATNDTATNHNQTKSRTPHISLMANYMAARGVTVCLFLVTMVMKTHYTELTFSVL